MATWLHAERDGAPMVFISEVGARQKVAVITSQWPSLECNVRRYYYRGELLGYVIRCKHNVQQQQKEFAQ